MLVCVDGGESLNNNAAELGVGETPVNDWGEGTSSFRNLEASSSPMHLSLGSTSTLHRVKLEIGCVMTATFQGERSHSQQGTNMQRKSLNPDMFQEKIKS